VPFSERKSILQQQALAISEDEDVFAPAEDTDLREEELEEHSHRMMSVRALNINILHRYSPF
jgi:hypothetical protein